MYGREENCLRTLPSFDGFFLQLFLLPITTKMIAISADPNRQRHPQKRFFEIIQSLMLRSNPARGLPLRGNPLDIRTTRVSDAPIMRMNHSSTGRNTSSSLHRQQCGYTCGYFSRATSIPFALSTAMSHPQLLRVPFAELPNPSRKTELSSSAQ